MDFGPEANAIIARLAAIDRERPVTDRARAEAALREHFVRLGAEPLPIRWADDAERGYLDVWSAAESAAGSAAWSAARSAALSAAQSAAWSAAGSAARSAAESAAESAAGSAARSAGRNLPAALERWIGIWLPFVDATEAGLWLF